MEERIEDLPEPTVKPDFCIQFQGFEEEFAQTVGRNLMQAVNNFSRIVPLEGLDGITVGFDYSKAIEGIERGFPCRLPPPTPTENENIGTGIGMALPIIRDGVVKTHIVFSPVITKCFQDGVKEEELKIGLKLLLHELGHVFEHSCKYKAFGNTVELTVNELIPDPLQRFLWGLSHHIWEEYCANRVAINFMKDWQTENEVFVSIAADYRINIHKSRKLYHLREINLEDFLSVVEDQLHVLLYATGVLFGAVDSVDEEVLSPQAKELLDATEQEALHSFHNVLKKIWDNLCQWESYNDFLDLNQPTLELLHSLKLYPSINEDELLHIDVPVDLS